MKKLLMLAIVSVTTPIMVGQTVACKEVKLPTKEQQEIYNKLRLPKLIDCNSFDEYAKWLSYKHPITGRNKLETMCDEITDNKLNWHDVFDMSEIIRQEGDSDGNMVYFWSMSAKYLDLGYFSATVRFIEKC